MNDEQRELIQKLFQSIEESFLSSERIQNSIEELKSKGVDLDLAVAVLLCLGNEKITPHNMQKNMMNMAASENNFEFNEVDKKFLKSLGINPDK
ncbi:hypothetical protein KKB18_11355 [bacterium]|nr:hypothetical protein [bacterium]